MCPQLNTAPWYIILMKKIFFYFVLLTPLVVFGQLNDFCVGGKGDPIFLETFGNSNLPVNANAIGNTTYTFINNGQPDDGEYTISSRFNWFPAWFNTTDRTPGDIGGRALIVNADDNTSGQFFQRTISGLCPSTTYEFSTWMLNITSLSLTDFCFQMTGIPGGIPINVRFEIWDESDSVILASGSTGDIFAPQQAIWQQYGLTFTTISGQENVILRILNNGVGGCGNDLALDDIQFVSCGDAIEIVTNTNQPSPLTFCDEPAGELQLEVNTILSVFDTTFYQWEQSLDGLLYTPIAGATNETFTTASLTNPGDYFFRVRIAESSVNLESNLCSAVSNIFLIQIRDRVPEPVTQNALSFCKGDVIMLEATQQNSDLNIRWYTEALGGDPVFEGRNYEVGTATTAGQFHFFAETFDPNFDCPSERVVVKVTIFEGFENLQNERILICPNQTITLTASQSTTTYLWSTGETNAQIDVSIPDLYTVEIVDNNGCIGVERFSVDFFVTSAVISTIQTINSDIVITTEGNIEDYEFSLDGINYQPEPVFVDLETGSYTIFIRDVFSCNTSDQKDFFHLNIPKHFSPNGDAVNDEFIINEVESVAIFNRYGKLIIKASNGIRWDGTYNGAVLPTDSYWYLLEHEGETFKGSILLKR